MNKSYKQLCAEPSVVSSQALKETIFHLQQSRPDIVSRLNTFLKLAPIDKPKEHKGSQDIDHIKLPIGESDFSDISQALGKVFSKTKDPKVQELSTYWHGELRFSQDFQG